MRANIAALTSLRATQASQLPPNAEQLAALARWSGWGAVPAVFDANAAAYERFEWARSELRELLSDEEYAAAERSTINAHYTDAAYVTGIWEAVETLGFHGGNVLEPGCGSGNFIGFAPEDAHMVGVELDPVTAAIAGALYPHAQIRNESFADTCIPEGTFDLVVGNVPFGDVALHDSRHNPAGHRIHNHFVVKGLHLTRPGGLMVVLTSRYTMDAANPAARREIAALADLVGAVRLPSGAHRRAAGTDVVTDVLILRRREDGRPGAGAEFERSHAVALDPERESLRINEYFVAHPEHVLGEMRLGQGDGGRPELAVAGERSAGPALRSALANIASLAKDADLLLSPTGAITQPHPVALVSPSARRPDGYLAAQPDETFTRLEQGREVPYRPAANQTRELRSLLGLRDTAVELLEAEAASIDETAAIVGLRKKLNDNYDRYVAGYGALNRFTERRTGRVDPTSGEEQLARIRPPQGGFRADPFANVVYALEHFDSATQAGTKATIFHERVVSRRAPQLGAETPADALAICLDSVGEARLDEIARLLGVAAPEARAELGTLVFDEPGRGRLVPAAEYLSGNVRAKLAVAFEASKDDARYGANVTALSGVIPRDLRPDEIHARLGAAWIDADHVRRFLRETLDDGTVEVEHPGGGLWAVRSHHTDSVLARSRWGTERYSAIDIAEALLEQRPIRIYDENADGERVFNATATVAAAEKATELGDRFSEWVWEAPERAVALARTYNERFNAIVPRSYDGAKLSLPGLAVTFQARPHQVAAVARVIHEPAVGLFHEVGAGKTAEMVMGAMELRRLGLVAKPAVVVPNHMLEQFSREWLQLYPQAKLLAAAKEDLERDQRRLFVAKCATGDWDAVVMTRSAFERIPMSPKVQRDYLTREISAFEAMLERAKAEDARFSIKRLQRMKLQAEERLKKKLDGAKDPGITFEQLGVDYLFVDEAHAYKNLRTTSNIPGMAVDGSQRATDLHMKIEYLRERHGRVATLATATPIANSMGEAYTMQRYLRPDLLEDAGISGFDQWAATFGETTTAIEVSPDGSGMRMQTRFAKFRNVPELLLQWRVSADIKTAEDLKLPVPQLAARASDKQRAPETVVVAASSELTAYVTQLARRADVVRSRSVDPTIDNMLKISSDGRAAGLDLRLVGGGTAEPQKVAVAAARVAAIYNEHRADTFPSPSGQPHPTRGALQLVFSDLGTPKPGEWSVYEQLRTQLVDRGVPREAIRFMHEARNDREKGELFAACRDGRVAVLVGSTERMGVGTNVQHRAIALHHLDCPWRPADIAQRDGRILRQGNTNPEVQILRYVTEGSFDAYLWQTVTRKAQFISQVMRGRLDVREIDDIGETALSYNEVKALATGNPLLLEQAQAQAEVSRLERLQRSHQRNQDMLRWTLGSHAERIGHLEQRVADADAALHRMSAGGASSLSVGGHVFEKRNEGNESLRRALVDRIASSRQAGGAALGELNGFAIITRGRNAQSVTVALHGVPDSDVAVPFDEIAKAALVTRLENRLSNLPRLRDADARDIVHLRSELERAHAELSTPFRSSRQLDAERSRLRDLNERISTSSREKDVSARAVAEPSGIQQSERAAAAGVEPDRERTARGEKLAAHWQELFAKELANVRSRAAALEQRLAKRVHELRHRVAEHQKAKPEKPNTFAIMVGARARYEAAVEVWSKDMGIIEQHEKRLERRRERVHEYAREPVAGYSTLGTRLATSKLTAREPQLARQLQEFREWSQAHQREKIAHERPRERSRGLTR